MTLRSETLLCCFFGQILDDITWNIRDVMGNFRFLMGFYQICDGEFQACVWKYFGNYLEMLGNIGTSLSKYSLIFAPQMNSIQ
jgi:hypothetical protein